MGVGIFVRVNGDSKKIKGGVKRGQIQQPKEHVSVSFSEGGEMRKWKAARINRENFVPVIRH